MRGTIRAIIRQMQSIPDDEMGHMQADILLLKAIKEYAESLATWQWPLSRQEWIKEEAKQLIDAYLAIHKPVPEQEQMNEQR